MARQVPEVSPSEVGHITVWLFGVFNNSIFPRMDHGVQLRGIISNTFDMYFPNVFFKLKICIVCTNV